MNVSVIDNAVAKVCKARGIAWSFALTTRCRLAVRKAKSREEVVKVLERVIRDWAKRG